jgi:hypothetical protein
MDLGELVNVQRVSAYMGKKLLFAIEGFVRGDEPDLKASSCKARSDTQSLERCMGQCRR